MKIPDATGYDTDLRYLATRYKQGGRTVYSLNLSLAQVRSLVPRPDPAETMPGNRAIRAGHAEGFSTYIRQRHDWVSPSMIFRAPTKAKFEFEQLQEVEGAAFGVLSFPRTAARDVNILDGQHRTLGFYMAEEQLEAEIERARQSLAAARRVADKNSVEVRDAQKVLDGLVKRQKELLAERVSIEVYIENSPTAYKQMFVDIADNALGITQSVKARFDSTRVVNRALEHVLDHPLLRDRVDLEGDYIRRGSTVLMGAKHVAELIRAGIVGVDGRVSRRQEAEWKEETIAATSRDQLDMLMEAFPPLRDLADNRITPPKLREMSLLGSIPVLRGLVSVIYELMSDRHHWTRAMVMEFFEKLAPHMYGSAYKGSIWIEHMPEGVFDEGAMAPGSRRQDVRAFVDTLVDWALDHAPFLDLPPVLPPEPTSEIELDAEPERESAGYRAAVLS